MSNSGTNISGKVILILIILVLLYLLTFGNADLLTANREERKRKLAENKKRLEDRYARVQSLLNRKKQLRIKLETVCRRVLFGVRLTLAVLLLGVLTVLHVYGSVSVLGLVECVGAGAFTLLLVGFVWIGGPTDFFKVWTYFEKKLTLKIYGKYIDIDKHIESHEKELQQIITDTATVDNELKLIEVEVTEILSEKN